MIKKYFDKLPYKKNYVIAAFVIWNLLFIPVIIEIFRNDTNPNIGAKMLPPLIFAFLTCVVVLISKKLRLQMLKEGKTLIDIRKDLFLILAISLVFILMQVKYLYNFLQV